MAYKQSLMKYAEKYGVSRASRKYNKSRSYIYFWRARWDGSVESSGLSVQASSQSSKSANPPFCLTSLATLRVPYHIQIMSCNISFFLKIKKERPKLSLFFFPIIKIFVQRL